VTDTLPREPTADECSDNAEIRHPNGRSIGYACWYPTMGGYVGKALVVPDSGCVDVYVWHDGSFPFDGHCQDCRVPRDPVVLHHCDGGQFVQFGQLIERIMEKHSD
jgi:hypothetical protein